MSIQHNAITDPNIHEPKGVASALSNTAYLANGTGSGTWRKLPTQGLEGVSGNGVANQVIVVDGSGSHLLTWPVAHGGVYFTNIGSPVTITYPSVYAKVAATTASAGNSPKEFTEGTNARLTYTGPIARHAIVQATVSLTQSSGSARDLQIAIFKNGVLLPASETVATIGNTEKTIMDILIDSPIVTNDYFELFVKNNGASGDVAVYTTKLSARAFLS